MKINKQIFQLFILMPILSFGLAACFDDEEDEGSVFHCSYEQRQSDCNTHSFSEPFSQKCATFNTANFREGWDVANHCQNTYTNGYSSGGSCSYYFEVRNVQQLPGTCPGDTAHLATLGGADSELSIEAHWTGGDVDLEVLTPMRKLVSSQSPQADGCTFSGDDRYVLNGPVESVQCQGVYLDGGYDLILSNHSAESVTVNIKVTKNGDVIHQQQLNVAPGEPQTHSVSVQ